MTQIAVCSRYKLDIRAIGSDLEQLRKDFDAGNFANISADCLTDTAKCLDTFFTVRERGVPENSKLLNLPPGGLTFRVTLNPKP